MPLPIQSDVLVETKDMSIAEWLKWRRNGIGGSDAAAVLGIHPFRSAIEVFLDKTGQAPDEEEPERAAERMYWGRKLEEPVAQRFTEANDVQVRRRNAILQHPDHPFMIANIDRFIVDPGNWGVLEVKTTSGFNRKAWEDDVPPYVVVQVQHYLAVTGLEYSIVAVLVGGNYYRQIRIQRDDALIENLIEIERRFWEGYVQNEIMPPPDGSKQTEEILNSLYSTAEEDSVIRLKPVAKELMREYEEARAQETQAKDVKREVKNKLKSEIGEHAVGVVQGGEVRWTPYEYSYFNKGALEEQYPEIYDEFHEKRSSRRFSIKLQDKEEE